MKKFLLVLLASAVVVYILGHQPSFTLGKSYYTVKTEFPTGAAVTSAQSGAAATSFARLSTTLSQGIDTHQAVFAASARSGRDAFTGLAVGMIVASLVMVAGCAWGLSRRLAEYR